MFNTASIYAWSYIESLSFLVNIPPSCGHVYRMARKLRTSLTTAILSEYCILGEVHYPLQLCEHLHFWNILNIPGDCWVEWILCTVWNRAFIEKLTVAQLVESRLCSLEPNPAFYPDPQPHDLLFWGIFLSSSPAADSTNRAYSRWRAGPISLAPTSVLSSP